jgi:ATP-dependent helicase/nuclease subunit A
MDRLGAEDRDGTRVLAQAWPDTRSAPPPAPAAPPAPPPWASAAPPRAPEPPRILSPSALGGAHALPGEPAGADPLERGARLHRLLEGLAGQPLAARATLAARLLPEAPDLPDLLAEAEAVLDAPALAPLFGPEARAEVAIAAPLGPARLLGRIDRLLVEPGRVLAADFKSNRLVPETPEATPEAILRQMGAYAAALMPLYPGRRIETAVVWTRVPALVTLPAALTGGALARALAAPPAP